MLDNAEAMATVAVKDLAKAGKFYEGTLGLERLDQQEEEALVFQAGASKLLVYRSQYAGTNKATTVTWNVGNDVDGMVRTLAGKGVRFEHYDLSARVSSTRRR